MPEREPIASVFAAHAKVNLFLAVGRRREDGYHEVTTLLQAVGLADDVDVVAGGPGIEVVSDPDLGVPPQDNLAHRAVRAWQRETGATTGASVTIAKRIPAGGGLGGGSADAAAVLAALGAWEGPGGRIDARLLRAAVSLGADVPFFLGPGTCVMSGRGDESAGALPTPHLDLVIVNPGVVAPTGDVYARFDELPCTTIRGPEAMIVAVRSADPEAIGAALHNDLAAAACSLVPETEAALQFLRRASGIHGATVAGSGSSVFGVCRDAEAAERAAGEARDLGWWARATTSVDAGVEPLGSRHRDDSGVSAR